MPTYTYQCNACEHQFETQQRMTDEPLTDCPECGKPELRKVITQGNFILKGSGWYQTEYAKKQQH